MTFGAQQFVGVGVNGKIVTSPDAMHWTSQTSPAGNTLFSVEYGDNQFVAVGAYNTILTSSNGVTWTLRSTRGSNHLQAIAYGNGTYVAVGTLGSVATSTNGVDWVAGKSGVTESLNSIAFGNGSFVAVGETNLLQSSDGVSWVKPAGAMGASNRVAFGNGRFLTDSGWVSTDGLQWSSVGGVEPNVSFAGGQFVVLSSYQVRLSGDGLVWTLMPLAQSPVQVLMTAFGSGSYVGVGSNGLLVSNDGTEWATTPPPSAFGMMGLAFAQDRFFSLGRYFPLQILSSPEGVTWTGSITSNEPALSALISLVFGNGRFVLLSRSQLASSEDGHDWTVMQLNLSLNDLAFGNGQFAGVGPQGRILFSGNGLGWATANSRTTNGLNSVAFGQDSFVAVGERGTVLTSSNSVDWSSADSANGQTLLSVAYGGGTFVAVGSAGTIVTSPDGTTWTSTPSHSTQPLQKIVFGNDIFVAIGSSDILLSANGVTWTRNITRLSGAFLGAAFGNGKFLVMDSTKLWTLDLAPAILDPPMVTPNGIVLPLTGVIGQTYRVQAASTLSPADWVDIGSVTNQQLTSHFIDTAANSAPHRFYRAVTAP
jgi:hypothetical protein